MLTNTALIISELELYINSRQGIPVPSIEDFCIRHNYSVRELKEISLTSKELRQGIEKIRTRAIVTLENFLLLDTSTIEFSNEDGRRYKLDKKGIIEQLKRLKK